MIAVAEASLRWGSLLALILSAHYPGSLAPEHLADLCGSGLDDQTIRLHKIRSVPPGMIGRLLGFDVPAIRSAMLIPFPDPGGGFMPHVRVKIFPPFRDRQGHTAKYLQPRDSGPRLYFPLLGLDEALHGEAPLWLVEGEKKSLAVARLGLPAVGLCGIEVWHQRGADELLSDFDALSLNRRVIELVPDSDWLRNPEVERGARRLARALSARGARVRLVQLPDKESAA